MALKQNNETILMEEKKTIESSLTSSKLSDTEPVLSPKSQVRFNENASLEDKSTEQININENLKKSIERMKKAASANTHKEPEKPIDRKELSEQDKKNCCCYII